MYFVDDIVERPYAFGIDQGLGRLHPTKARFSAAKRHDRPLRHGVANTETRPVGHQAAALVEIAAPVIGRVQFALRVGQAAFDHVLVVAGGLRRPRAEGCPHPVRRGDPGVAHILEQIAERGIGDHGAALRARKDIVG